MMRVCLNVIENIVVISTLKNEVILLKLFWNANKNIPCSRFLVFNFSATFLIVMNQGL